MPTEIRGLPVILSNFDRLTMKDVLVQAASAGAEPIREQASQNAPVDKSKYARHPGRLKRLEILKVASRQNDRVIVKIGPAKTALEGLFVELGTVHMAPQPFLGPALEMKSQQAISETANVLTFALNAKAHA